jgi:hypothetical protein
MTTKRVGDTLTIQHLPDERGLRIQGEHEHESTFVPLSLVRALSPALLDAAADVAGELVGVGGSVAQAKQSQERQ